MPGIRIGVGGRVGGRGPGSGSGSSRGLEVDRGSAIVGRHQDSLVAHILLPVPPLHLGEVGEVRRLGEQGG